MASYCWVITKDHINDGVEEGINGPHGVTDEQVTEAQTKGTAFKMYDDDGELYYRGRITGEFDGFEPLDDFGGPNAGCTGIKYRKETKTLGKFEYL